MLLIGPGLLVAMQPDFSNLAFLLFMVPASLGIGLCFPSTLMSILAVSAQRDQAVAASTLFMWRTLGAVLGVASSSLIVQNSLLYYLKKRVTGGSPEEIAEVIEKVRKSVHAVFELEKGYQGQVVGCYVSTLRVCFGWAVVTAVVTWGLTLGIKLPALRRVDEYRKLQEAEGEEEED